MKLTSNPIQTSRTKHAAVRYEFPSETVEQGGNHLTHVGSRDQLVDALPAQRLGSEAHSKHRKFLANLGYESSRRVEVAAALDYGDPTPVIDVAWGNDDRIKTILSIGHWVTDRVSK